MRIFIILAGFLWFGALMTRAATTYYVATNGTGDGSSWVLATNSIQGAISRATAAGDVVLVSNGMYATGGVTNWPSGTLLTNRVAITNAITVRSANNDPTNTIIKGNWDAATNGPAAVRCVYMANGSSLIGFTLTNGATLVSGVANDTAGGGIWCPSTNSVISNCVVARNSADYGGGVWYGTLFDCAIISNSASSGGGGAYNSTFYNCTIVGNSAGAAGGGGASAGTLYNCMIVGNRTSANGGGVYNTGDRYNCTIVGNSAGVAGGGVRLGTLYNCISWSNNIVDVQVTASYSCGVGYTNGGSVSGNITNNPIFIADGSGYGTNHVAGNYRLSPNSPGINAGTNFAWMTNTNDTRSKDLDGRKRIQYVTVDMGAYEVILRGTIISFY